jgi:hypothetical protein
MLQQTAEKSRSKDLESDFELQHTTNDARYDFQTVMILHIKIPSKLLHTK